MLTLEPEIEDVIVDIDRAIPCGLMVNELVTNSLKYAFPEAGKMDGPHGTVRLSVRAAGTSAEVEVSDNGVGLPADFDPAAGGTLGMELVRALSNQIGGEFHFHSGRPTAPSNPVHLSAGTSCIITIPLQAPTK
jgi:two-component sensor histidine kinase